MGVKFYTPFSAFKGVFSTADIEHGLRPIIIYDKFRRMWEQDVTVHLIPLCFKIS
jgi:hypothetical protein